MRQPNAADAITKLSGYCEIGMTREALKLAREILSASSLTEGEFQNCAVAILTMSTPLERDRGLVETAYGRLSPAARKRARRTMLGFYCSLHDFATAEKFVPARPSTFDDLLFGMNSFLALGNLVKAKKLVRRCETRLRVERDGFARNSLHDALADYYARMHKWGKAIEHWGRMDLSEPLGDNAFVGLVEIKVADTIETTKAAMKSLDHYRKQRHGKLELQLPGNEAAILDEARGKLASHLRHLERALPPKRQREFGMKPDQSRSK